MAGNVVMFVGRVYAELLSVQNVQIEMSYVPMQETLDGQNYFKATGFSINIQGRFAPIAHPHCQFILINRNDDAQDVHFATIYSVGSEPGGFTYFSAGIDGRIAMFSQAHDRAITSHPQVAININGFWQIDPIQCNPHIESWQPHNFNFAWRW